MEWYDCVKVEMRPVVYGKWLKHEEKQYMGQRYVEWTCSQCGRIGKRGWSTKSANIDKPPLANFCPKCGADMRGKENDSL